MTVLRDFLVLDAYQIDIMARTIYGEARGEPDEGMVAVGYVILNRAGHPQRWPNSPAEACRQAHQFSCWNENDPNYRLISVAMDYADPLNPAKLRCLNAVVDIIGFRANEMPDPTDGANHYHADTMPHAPGWAAQMIQTAHIGHHIFYRDE